MRPATRNVLMAFMAVMLGASVTSAVARGGWGHGAGSGGGRNAAAVQPGGPAACGGAGTAARMYQPGQRGPSDGRQAASRPARSGSVGVCDGGPGCAATGFAADYPHNRRLPAASGAYGGWN